MSKYIKTKELADYMLPLLVRDENNWIYFLDFSSKHYKYPFYDQVMIFAQRPEATACANFETWNKVLHRSVNKGAKGIALLREGLSGGYLEYVFDVSDTNDRYGRVLPIWQYENNSHEQAVKESLISTFGEVEDTDHMENFISEVVSNAVTDNYADYYAALSETHDESESDTKQRLSRFLSGLSASVTYCVLVRMKLDYKITGNDLTFLIDFIHRDDINVLGCALRDITEGVLRTVEKTVRQENRKIDTLANDHIFMQNENNNTIYGGINNADRIYDGGRSDAAEYHSDEKTQEPDREIRSDQARVSENFSQDTLFGSDLIGGDDESLKYDRPRGENSGADNLRPTAPIGSSAKQNNRSDRLGSAYERYQTYSRGNRDQRIDQELSFFQTEEEQIEIIEKAEAKTSAFYISQDEIDEILMRGSGFADGNLRIYAHYLNNPSKSDSISFLKEEFGTGGYTHALSRDEHSYQDHSPKGIFISKGNIVNPDAQILLGWEKVDKRYRELITLGLFPSDDIKEKYPAYLETLNTRDKDEEVLALSESETDQIETETIKIGEPVSIGDRKYIVDRIDGENVSLQDVTFQNATGFPIFRIEPMDVVLKNIINKEISATTLAAENFHITDFDLGHGGLKVKYGYNISAIKLLKKLDEENRTATNAEQAVLSKYVGWGGLQNVFDETKTEWSAQYQELKALLTDAEYSAARESVLNAFYTPPVVIHAMYDALSQKGFTNGNILEPSMGIGNFFGMLPGSMQTSKLYGVELDCLTARIAKHLYPNADIRISGFEETSFPENFFDIAIGNVPFGNYGVNDKAYHKNNFMIHDYFFAKTLDKLRSGGVIAFITSKGTMDKKSSEVRKYIAHRAELLGAIRLPNNTFAGGAATTVTTDILFLKKRQRMMEVDDSWIHLGLTEDNIPINSYYVENPQMVLGVMTKDHNQYGREDSACIPTDGANLSDQLKNAITYIDAVVELDDPIVEEMDESIPADPNVRNFSFTTIDDILYFRENSRMAKVTATLTATHRIKALIALRECVRNLIMYQLDDYSDEIILSEQAKLNNLYETFTKQYGLITSRANSMAFSDDTSYYLLCSLEILDQNNELERKADMFTKRTIHKKQIPTNVDTPVEALAVSIAEKACVDLSYMSELLSGKDTDEIANELRGIIFYNPMSGIYESSDEFLSGNVRTKLSSMEHYAKNDPEKYSVHVTALTQVQPKDLDAAEIDVRLGATWIPQNMISDFVYELLSTPRYLQRNIEVQYAPYTASWNITGKNQDISSIHANLTYGTNRMNAYKIIEESLNLKDVRIFDYVTDENGSRKAVFNAKETTLAQQKQTLIKEAFKDWIFGQSDRRTDLVHLYNDKFNAIRPRVYDGSHISFTGMNPEIHLREHQINAVAHILYGGNTLLAHVVGAGKTYEMVAAAMESKRLGLSQKSLFVVPNHLTEQWASEFLQLYPAANILVSTRKDFETKNRKKFCARIATGEYDAVIIGHSQFEKIPMSIERQRELIENEIDEITDGISQIKYARGDQFTIKQLEKTRKTLKLRLDKLNDTSRKDDVITFEELGVDRLFVDEAHSFKNLFLYTKMRNVAGISQSEALKSSDLYMKTRYMDEITNRRGVIFATGTPISNSMTELYTMQRYLQYDELKAKDLHHFDAWASTFGETISAIELKPEGTGYRSKTRFAKFYNLPELMNMFLEVADIQTADMLNLPVPKVSYYAQAVSPSEYQKEMISDLAERADAVRARMVEPYEDNMLKITNDGRKLALDQRMMSELLPDDNSSKVNQCVNNAYELWQKNEEKSLAQLIFCDLSTPHYDNTFNVYDDVKNKLVERGIPNDQIVFIHDANTESKKVELFMKVRKGQIRILIGSTAKMGAGTNVQNLLIALHHLDIPWRPSDIEQREGRIVRQGNQNDEVEIFRYVTEGTFDAYMWQTIENKQRFIAQIMTSKSPVRCCEDIDETALSYAEIKMLACGNPYIKEKMDLDMKVARLKLLKANYQSQRYHLEDIALKSIPMQIAELKSKIAGYEEDIAFYHANRPNKSEDEKTPFIMIIDGVPYDEKVGAGSALIEKCKQAKVNDTIEIGSYLGFSMHLYYESFFKEFHLKLKNVLSHDVILGTDPIGNITRIGNTLEGMAEKVKTCNEKLLTTEDQLQSARDELDKPFSQEEELKVKSIRLTELDNILSLNENVQEGEILSDDVIDDEIGDRKEVVER